MNTAMRKITRKFKVRRWLFSQMSDYCTDFEEKGRIICANDSFKNKHHPLKAVLNHKCQCCITIPRICFAKTKWVGHLLLVRYRAYVGKHGLASEKLNAHQWMHPHIFIADKVHVLHVVQHTREHVLYVMSACACLTVCLHVQAGPHPPAPNEPEEDCSAVAMETRVPCS